MATAPRLGAAPNDIYDNVAVDAQIAAAATAAETDADLRAETVKILRAAQAQ